MTDNNFSIVFMGTPEFAVAILDKLIENNVEVKAVVTAPDKPAGRGQKIHMSAVKQCALKHNLDVLQPTSLKDESFIGELKSYRADLFVVVAFRMLPESVWSLPPKGTINLHASLLPQYRGAAPINWAIINGERKTGVTTFFIEKEIDTGKIIDQQEVAISENETVGELYERLMNLGAELMVSTVEKIKEGNIKPIDQSETNITVTQAPKIFKSDCRIDFNKPVQQVHNFCRGLSPYPAAWCVLENKNTGESKSFKIFITRVTDIATDNTLYIRKGENGLLFPCQNHYLEVRELQPEGKRRMDFSAFLAGNDISDLSIKEN